MPRLAIAFLLRAAAPAQAETCTWSRLSPEAFEEGPCTVEWTDRGATVTMDTRRWDIRERDRQGRWSEITLNGAEGMRFEVDREHYAHSTADLNESLDIAP